MKYSPEPAEANTILCLEIFHPKPKEYPLRHTLSYGKQVKSLADWTMNRSHDSGTVKTGSRIIIYENKFPTENKFLTD